MSATLMKSIHAESLNSVKLHQRFYKVYFTFLSQLMMITKVYIHIGKSSQFCMPVLFCSWLLHLQTLKTAGSIGNYYWQYKKPITRLFIDHYLHQHHIKAQDILISVLPVRGRYLKLVRIVRCKFSNIYSILVHILVRDVF